MPPLTSLAGGRLFARRHGQDAIEVVALHGWGRSGADFDRVLAGLSGLAVDLPGFGASPPPESVWGAGDYAAALAPILSGLPTPPVVVGHSFGGRVAVSLAAARPELVSGLVLTGVPLLRRSPPRRPPASYRLMRAAHRRGLVPERWMERLRRRRGSADYRAAEGIMRQVLVRAVNESYEAELAELAAPVRLLWGEADGEVPLGVAQQAAARLEAEGIDVSLRVLPGVGHLVPLEAPQALREEIQRVGR